MRLRFLLSHCSGFSKTHRRLLHLPWLSPISRLYSFLDGLQFTHLLKCFSCRDNIPEVLSEQSRNKVRRGTELVDQIQGMRKGGRGRGVYSFPVIAITDYHKLGDLQHRNVFSHTPGSQTSKNKFAASF